MSWNSLNPGLNSFLLKLSPCLAPCSLSICTILRCSLFWSLFSSYEANKAQLYSNLGCFRTKVSAVPYKYQRLFADNDVRELEPHHLVPQYRVDLSDTPEQKERA
jgi:hypothetical protein